MQGEDEEVKLQVKLDPHGLGVSRSHGDGHELGKLGEEGLALSLVEVLHRGRYTARSSFLISSCEGGLALVCLQQSLWKAYRVSL